MIPGEVMRVRILDLGRHLVYLPTPLDCFPSVTVGVLGQRISNAYVWFLFLYTLGTG